MKIKYGSDGLEMNSIKYSQNNLSLHGIEVEVGKIADKQEPFAMLGKLASLKASLDETTDMETISSLKNITS